MKIYTPKEFCRLTGWPWSEFRKLRITELAEILDLYDLKLVLIVHPIDEIGLVINE